MNELLLIILKINMKLTRTDIEFKDLSDSLMALE